MSAAPAARPCGSCPYRRDVPSGVWSEEEYAKLPGYDDEVGISTPFFCHQQDGRLCAGWVGCHDMDASIALRVGAAAEVLSIEDVRAARAYVSPVPLFESGAAAAEHGRAGIESPDEDARRAIDRLTRKRARRGEVLLHVETLGPRDGLPRVPADLGRCECGKIGFASEDDALSSAIARSGSGTYATCSKSAYRCAHGAWHIRTSPTPRKLRKGATRG